jgi:hypothetical protein
MVRSYNKIALLVVLTALMVGALGATSWALSLYWPKPDQIVRENVKISLAGKDVPEGSFVSVLVGEEGKENFVLAVDADSVRTKNGTVDIFWNSKTPYRSITDPKTFRCFTDGKYSIRVEVHNQSNLAKIIGSATVPVVLKNKIARSNPAPGISLVNKLSFGQTNTFRVTSNVEVFEVVHDVGLPVASGLGLSGDFTVVQSVEDIRSTGEYLLRYRIGDKPSVVTYGQKMVLYENDLLKPQLYRLMTKYGQVTNSNLFSKQAKFTITDILPVLPKTAVKEGDSWPSTISLKIEGLTDAIELKGTCGLDSFEWQDGHECAKLISNGMQGTANIVLDGGKIRSSSNKVSADVVTYFDYKNGKTIRRDIVLDIPAVIAADAGDPSQAAAAMGSAGVSGGYSSSPFGDEGEPANMTMRSSRSGYAAYGGESSDNLSSRAKKGKVLIRTSIVLEK